VSDIMQETAAPTRSRPRRTERADVDDQSALPNCPPRACKPWCIEGDGHPDQQSSDDQFCISRAREVVLRTRPSADVNEHGDALPSQIAVVLIADIDKPTRVEIVLDDIAGHTANINLTCEEAHDLAVDLLILVTQSRGKL
jgi:hypothetical protein